MKIYDYTKYGQCFLGPSVDDRLDEIINRVNKWLEVPLQKQIHPKEIERQERLKKRIIEERDFRVHDFDMPRTVNQLKKLPNEDYADSYKNGVLIFVGSCGFGTKDFEYFDKKFSELNEVLSKNNLHILFVRGSEDDPSYFDEEKINYSNIKSLVSNCIVKFNEFSCLCIGGGISCDRKWKMSKEKEYGTKMYWENEGVNFDVVDVRKAINEENIACVISSEVPTFVTPSTGLYKSIRWFKNDKQLLKDKLDCRMKMDTIYSEFLKAGKKPYVWWNSTITDKDKSLVNEIVFKGAKSIEKLNRIVYDNFATHLTKEEAKPKHSSYVSFLPTDSFAYTTSITAEPAYFELQGVVADLEHRPAYDRVNQAINELPRVVDAAPVIEAEDNGRLFEYAFNDAQVLEDLGDARA